MPLTKEDVLKRGWNWRDDVEEGQKVMGPVVTIPDGISDVPDDISTKVLTCEASGKQFKIIPQELKFYRQSGIPLPHRSPAQRHKDRNALRNPRKLWKRNCANCNKPLATSYEPGRPERIYCEPCYLKSVY